MNPTPEMIATLRDFASTHAVEASEWDAALILSEGWLLENGTAFENDAPIPVELNMRMPKHFGFHARRWLVQKLRLRGAHVKLPVAVDEVLCQRWPEPDGQYTGFSAGKKMSLPFVLHI